MASLLESHNIKKCTLSTYLLHVKYFLHMKFYLTKHLLVCCHTRHTLVMRPAVSYILYATSSHEQTGDIITFSHFEKNNLVEEQI